MRRLHVAVAAICAVMASVSLAAGYASGSPQPQGQPPLRPPATAPGQTPPAPRPATPATPPTAAAAPAPKAAPAATVPAAEPAPTAQSLGLPVYPAAQYLGTYDAGRSQKYVLFGTTSAFLDVVGYYRTQLGDKGDQVFKEPLTHVFEVGRFREETMAFPPGVTVKDWTSGGSQGYPYQPANAAAVRFPTVIMLVPQPPAPQTPKK